MGKYKATSKNSLAGGLLLGAVASSLAVVALSGAGTANAGCVSISGQTFTRGGGGECFTAAMPGDIAVANGAGSYADAGAFIAGGPGNIAIAAGTQPNASGESAIAEAFGAGNFALANGAPGANPGTGTSFPTGPPINFNITANPSTLTEAFVYGVQNK